jgi:hypothetical protein
MSTHAVNIPPGRCGAQLRASYSSPGQHGLDSIASWCSDPDGPAGQLGVRRLLDCGRAEIPARGAPADQAKYQAGRCQKTQDWPTALWASVECGVGGHEKFPVGGHQACGHAERRREAPEARKLRDSPAQQPRPVTTEPKVLRWQAEPERRAACGPSTGSGAAVPLCGRPCGHSKRRSVRGAGRGTVRQPGSHGRAPGFSGVRCHAAAWWGEGSLCWRGAGFVRVSQAYGLRGLKRWRGQRTPRAAGGRPCPCGCCTRRTGPGGNAAPHAGRCGRSGCERMNCAAPHAGRRAHLD